MPRPPKNEAGKRYGCLTVMQADHRPSGPDGRNRAYWICKCDCGNEKSVLGDHLRNRATMTCAQCNLGPRRGPRVRTAHPRGKVRAKWEIGNRYGILTVIERQEKSIDARRGAEARWICRCDCGNETVANGGDLRSGDYRSCGCARRRWHDGARAAKAETA